MKSKKKILEEMNSLKEQMIRIGLEKGMNHSLTIQTSQKLDKLINEYMKLTQQK